MPEGQIAQGVQLLDLMLEYFADDGRMARDGDIGVLGALTFFSRQLHECRATPARGLPAFRYGGLPVQRGRRR